MVIMVWWKSEFRAMQLPVEQICTCACLSLHHHHHHHHQIVNMPNLIMQMFHDQMQNTLTYHAPPLCNCFDRCISTGNRWSLQDVCKSFIFLFKNKLLSGLEAGSVICCCTVSYWSVSEWDMLLSIKSPGNRTIKVTAQMLHHVPGKL